MRRLKPSALLILCLCSGFFWIPFCAASPNTAEILAGAGKAEITPPQGTPLAGYGRRHGKESEGVHDPLFARALALRRGENQFVYVSADLVLIDEDLRKETLDKIRQKKSIRDEELVLFATHTHSGAGAIGGRFWERFIMGKFKRPAFEAVTNGLAQAALKALEAQVAVTAQYGETGIAEWIENRMDERLDLPPRLRAIRFIKEDGSTAGEMLFMAAHPTLLPAGNLHFSADYPGVLLRECEKNSAVCLFVNGAAGDLRPRVPNTLFPSPAGRGQGEGDDRFKKMEAYGTALAEKAALIDFKPLSLEGRWHAELERVRLPRTRARAGWFPVPSLLGGRVFPRKSYFQAVRLGPVLLLTYPGELDSETGRQAERLGAAREFQTFIIGYANDYTGYTVPRRHYKNRDHYESTASFYGGKLPWFYLDRVEGFFPRLLTPEEQNIFRPAGKLVRQDGLPVLILKGDPYHAGYEEGRLLAPEIKAGTDQIFRYFRRELKVPLAGRVIINHLLDRAWKQMEPYVSYEEYLYMKGLAAGSGLPWRAVRRVHAMPEVYPTWCTNGAYWGDATAGGRLIAIRNLDWNRAIGIHRRAAVKMVRIPGHHAYVNIGYYGFAGVLSGMNEKGISIGQIGAVSADETMRGVPMPFLIKRILEEAGSVEEAAEILRKADRTRGYNYVIADAVRKEAAAIETTHNHIAVFHDSDEASSSVPYVYPVKNAVFRGDPALDPAVRDLQWASKGNPEKAGAEMPAGSAYEIRYLKHGQLVKEHYGEITPEIAMQIAREIAPGSNIQSVIYAFPEFWAANAEGDKRAADSEYKKFNFEELSNAA